MQYFISKYHYYLLLLSLLLLLLFVSLFISGESPFLKRSSLCVAVAGPTNFAPIINQIARWVVDAIYKGAICFWVDKWFVSAQVWPNFHYFFSNSESICDWIRLKSGPSQGEDDFIWAYTQPNCFAPRADFPHSRKFYFLVSVKRFFFIFVSTSLGVFLKRQVCQGWGFDMLLFVLYAIELQVHHTEKSRDRSMYHN